MVPDARTVNTIAAALVAGFGLLVWGSMDYGPAPPRWLGLAVLLLACTATVVAVVHHGIVRVLATLRYGLACPHCGKRPTQRVEPQEDGHPRVTRVVS